MSLTKEITDQLFKQFETHKYMLANSYVYKWESDFFSQLTSGYHQEVEVKISRSDFLADFKKEDKHRVIRQKSEGAPKVCYKSGPFYKVKYEEQTSATDEFGRRLRGEDGRVIRIGSGRIRTMTTMQETVKGEISRELSHSSIYFVDANCPNRFYYCCPEGLIKVEEMPDYAGLLYYSEGRFRKAKNAPLIHKEKRNLSQVLLDKFYYKYLYSR